MNPDNYGTPEACKKLAAVLARKGIVIETDAEWGWNGREFVLSPRGALLPGIPAYSMPEVWRELPEGTILRKTLMGETECWIRGKGIAPIPHSTNPTDALIELWIWVLKQEESHD